MFANFHQLKKSRNCERWLPKLFCKSNDHILGIVRFSGCLWIVYITTSDRVVITHTNSKSTNNPHLTHQIRKCGSHSSSFSKFL